MSTSTKQDSNKAVKPELTKQQKELALSLGIHEAAARLAGDVEQHEKVKLSVSAAQIKLSADCCVFFSRLNVPQSKPNSVPNAVAATKEYLLDNTSLTRDQIRRPLLIAQAIRFAGTVKIGKAKVNLKKAVKEAADAGTEEMEKLFLSISTSISGIEKGIRGKKAKTEVTPGQRLARFTFTVLGKEATFKQRLDALEQARKVVLGEQAELKMQSAKKTGASRQKTPGKPKTPTVARRMASKKKASTVTALAA